MTAISGDKEPVTEVDLLQCAKIIDDYPLVIQIAVLIPDREVAPRKGRNLKQGPKV